MADAGMVHTLEVTFDDGCEVRPYQQHDPPVRRKVEELLDAEWGSGASGPVIDEAMILSKWPGADVLYVMTDGGSVVGCVAVDRERFFPFVSHLCIAGHRRGRGDGRRLLDVAEQYAGGLGFTEIKIWCSDTLVPFYAKSGWSVEDRTAAGVHVMTKGT